MILGAQVGEEKLGVVLIDHGSRREEANRLLDEVVAMFQQQTGLAIVEPAHMELAEPTLETAFEKCVEQGAELVVVFPYFLGPGRHWDEDIPRLAAAAARQHPSVRYQVTAPLGKHPLMGQVIAERIHQALQSYSDEAGSAN